MLENTVFIPKITGFDQESPRNGSFPCARSKSHLERQRSLGIGIVQVEPPALLARGRCGRGRRAIGAAKKREPLREHGEARGGANCARLREAVRLHGFSARSIELEGERREKARARERREKARARERRERERREREQWKE